MTRASGPPTSSVSSTKVSATRRIWWISEMDAPSWSTRRASQRGHVAAAAERGLEIAYTADTHSHADFVSGSPSLPKLRRRVPRVEGRGPRGPPPRRRSRRRDRTQATPSACAIATPGHTPDHSSLHLLPPRAAKPVAFFSGGSLMVGAPAGRNGPARPGAPRESWPASSTARFTTRSSRSPTICPYTRPTARGHSCSADRATERTTHDRPRRRHEPPPRCAPT